MTASNKKHYFSETIELQNGDHTLARPLTIRSLREFQEVFKDYGTAVSRQTEIMQEAISKAKRDEKDDAIEDKERSARDHFAEAQKLIKEENLMDYVDVLCQGALIALRSWDIKTPKGTKVPLDKIDMDYIEENLDTQTAERICEVAGSMTLGDTSEESAEPGKAGA